MTAAPARMLDLGDLDPTGDQGRVGNITDPVDPTELL